VPVLELNHLSKSFHGPDGSRRRVLFDLNLAVNDGELMVLAGPSGGGKTTTLRLIAGLEEPDEGQIILDGGVLDRVPADRRDVAMVFQSLALLPHLTAFENLALGLRLRKTPVVEIERRITEAAELLGIAPCLNRRPKALSGGERQRVALGRALVRRPRLFLLDEPLAHLDAVLRRELRALIARVREHLGTAMIFVTHDQADAMTLGHRVAVLHEGRIQQVGRPMEIYDRPANLFVAGFFGSPPMNLLPGELAEEGGGMAWVAPASARAEGRALSLPLPPERAAQLRGLVGHEIIAGIRPERIAVSSASDAIDTPGTIAASVRACEVLGSDTAVRLDVGGVEVVAKTSPPVDFTVGQRVRVRFDPDGMHLFDPGTGQAVVEVRARVGKVISGEHRLPVCSVGLSARRNGSGVSNQ
jgi:multiple sugar transport system ATP-binding protein